MQALTEAVAIDGFWLLVAAAAVAGLVRGFSGFGTAMVYLPVAGQILTPFQALTTLMVMDLIGPLPNIPSAIRTGHKRDILRLSAGTLVALPLGVLVLGLIAPEVFRYGVSLISLLLLVLLMAGVRYHGTLRPPMVYGTGAVGGFLAGSVGLPGPPVIMLYMASPNPSEVIRANIMVYLLLCDLMMIGVLHLNGYLQVSAVALGALLILPYLAANVLGGWLFRPGYERLYRAIAYFIIAASALNGMPLFD
ncbi:sulfite exporter TauE/SafE family protein [Profundibacter amoris]|uniref:Probable membrane transporter protein n=1 Tax=Profundibacter amoris TaxID=2171755 RepID=A0A347UFB6_9RHOB|nr:sulfite exporter TauE/SafE family protein [Profundibacter amoris]AXX97544.1 sulfite exporter TauE/SafE family protein [Profundibacter amoris]